MDKETIISGHPNEWVALVDNTIIASSKTFPELVKKLEAGKLLKKALVTYVRGTYAVL